MSLGTSRSANRPFLPLGQYRGKYPSGVGPIPSKSLYLLLKLLKKSFKRPLILLNSTQYLRKDLPTSRRFPLPKGRDCGPTVLRKVRSLRKGNWESNLD